MSAPALDWEDVRLTIPGVGKPMRTARIPDLTTFDGSPLDGAPIIVSFGGPSVTKLFDASTLEPAYGDRWPAAQAAIESVQALDIHRALTEIAAEGALVAEGAQVFAAAESLMLETAGGGPTTDALLAALVLVLIQSRLERLMA